MPKHISCDCKCKFNSTICNPNHKLNNKICQCECKNYRTYTNDYSSNRKTCIYEYDKYLKSIVDTSMIACGETVSVMDNASIKMTINFDDKKVRYKIDCNILYTILLVIILLLIITNICYHYAKHRSNKKVLMH